MANRKIHVSIVKGTDVESMVRKVLSYLGGVSSLIKPNSTVVIKPNVGHPSKRRRASIRTGPGGCVMGRSCEAKRRRLSWRRPQPGAATRWNASRSAASGGGGAGGALTGHRHQTGKRTDPDTIRDARAAVDVIQLPRFLLEADHIVNMPILQIARHHGLHLRAQNIKGSCRIRPTFKCTRRIWRLPS